MPTLEDAIEAVKRAWDAKDTYSRLGHNASARPKAAIEAAALTAAAEALAAEAPIDRLVMQMDTLLFNMNQGVEWPRDQQIKFLREWLARLHASKPPPPEAG